MSIELSILKLFCESREIEATHFGYLDVIENLEREIRTLFKLVHTYYKEYETDSISKEELLNYFEYKYPKKKDKDLYLELIGVAFASDITTDLVKGSLDQLIEKHFATSIVNKLLPVMEGEKFGVLDTITEDVREYQELLYFPPERLLVPTPCTLSIKELIEQEIHDGGIPWHLDPLTEIIGGLRSKTLGLIYAFVDSGKTSFALAACAAFARALQGSDELIAYAGNEEAAPRVRLRLVQAMLNWTRGQIDANEEEATKLAIERGLDRVLLFDEIFSGDQLTYILNEHRPSILFVDQATNVDIHTKRKSDGVEYLKVLFQWYRRLANRHDCAIIGVSQGVGEAENKRWLKLSDIYGSRVAIQGALDYGVGIGRKVDDPVLENIRYIHIPKNKLHDGDGGKLTVKFTRQQCLWRPV